MHFEQELAIEFARNSIRFRVLRVHFWDSLWRCETREKYGCKRGRSSAVLVLAAGRSFAFRFDRPFTARRFSQITHKHTKSSSNGQATRTNRTSHTTAMMTVLQLLLGPDGYLPAKFIRSDYCNGTKRTKHSARNEPFE